jgi:hypothetical protein
MQPRVWKFSSIKLLFYLSAWKQPNCIASIVKAKLQMVVMIMTMMVLIIIRIRRSFMGYEIIFS